MAGGRRAKVEAANQCQASRRDGFPCLCVCVSCGKGILGYPGEREQTGKRKSLY